MLLRLIRTHVRPYRWPITIIVVLQFASTLAALYLPSLNADIIDNGVARGDTGYILRVGGWMLLVSLVQAAT
ncbi:MAG: ABC transporter ATP-binding protein, partial [Acidimicrobiales bacterium]|nr:ABC transporter ATP-binding protein [Acidimicrobiales bacterium]